MNSDEQLRALQWQNGGFLSFLAWPFPHFAAFPLSAPHCTNRSPPQVLATLASLQGQILHDFGFPIPWMQLLDPTPAPCKHKDFLKKCPKELCRQLPLPASSSPETRAETSGHPERSLGPCCCGTAAACTLASCLSSAARTHGLRERWPSGGTFPPAPNHGLPEVHARPKDF